MKASKEYANNSRLHRLCDSTKAAIERAINEARKEAVNECAKRLRIRLYAGRYEKDFAAGDKVHYTAPHGSKENGIIKSLNESKTAAFVVYNCDNDWDNYFNYTAANTTIEDLSFGWVEK